MRSIFLSALSLLFFTSAFAQKGYILPPPNFELSDGNKAIFVNILWSRSQIVVDVERKRAEAITQFEFQTWEEGMPIFDLIDDPEEVTLNGEIVTTKTIRTPDNETKVRLINAQVSKGNYLVTVKNQIRTNLKFASDSASLGFWYSDLDDREYLEQYLPANFEFDSYFMVLRLKVVGTSNEHALLSNGVVTPIEVNEWNISYPEFYNASSLFLHLGPSNKFQAQRTEFASMNGRKLPVTVYTKDNLARDLDAFTERAHLTLRELERDYGPFPHAQLIIYANQSFGGGMEYAGATITNLWALAHEITHSYFGRAVIPANGNSGWIDEAVASWRDSGYPRYEDPGYSSGNLAGFSPYRRSTTMDAYSKGRDFIAYLDHLLAGKGSSMKIFLKDLVTNRAFQPLSTTFFKQWLEELHGESLTDDFTQYVYNGGRGIIGDEDRISPRSPFHPRLTKAQLEKLL